MFSKNLQSFAFCSEHFSFASFRIKVSFKVINGLVEIPRNPEQKNFALSECRQLDETPVNMYWLSLARSLIKTTRSFNLGYWDNSFFEQSWFIQCEFVTNLLQASSVSYDFSVLRNLIYEFPIDPCLSKNQKSLYFQEPSLKL